MRALPESVLIMIGGQQPCIGTFHRCTINVSCSSFVRLSRHAVQQTIADGCSPMLTTIVSSSGFAAELSVSLSKSQAILIKLGLPAGAELNSSQAASWAARRTQDGPFGAAGKTASRMPMLNGSSSSPALVSTCAYDVMPCIFCLSACHA